MKMSNSNPKADTIDYYSIVAGIRPGRSPSIYHKEYKYYWVEFPCPPVYKSHSTSFYKFTPLPHCVDCSRYGQVHYWARLGSVFCPALVVFHLTTEDVVRQIRYYFYGGLWVENKESKPMIEIANPDLEIIHYSLSGFMNYFLSRNYSFNQ